MRISDWSSDVCSSDLFKGLNSTNPWLAGLVLCVMASLAGIPFFIGFWAKVAVLRAAIDGGFLWLAIAGLVFAVIGAFYRSEERSVGKEGVSRGRSWWCA